MVVTEGLRVFLVVLNSLSKPHDGDVAGLYIILHELPTYVGALTRVTHIMESRPRGALGTRNNAGHNNKQERS